MKRKRTTLIAATGAVGLAAAALAIITPAALADPGKNETERQRARPRQAALRHRRTRHARRRPGRARPGTVRPLPGRRALVRLRHRLRPPRRRQRHHPLLHRRRRHLELCGHRVGREAAVADRRRPGRGQPLGAGDLLRRRRRPLLPLLLGFDVRQPDVGHRPGHEHDARPGRRRLRVGRPGPGLGVEPRRPVQRDRPDDHRGRRRALHGLRLVVAGHLHARTRLALGQGRERRHAGPHRRPRRLGHRGALADRARRLLLPVHVMGRVLRGRGLDVQHPGRALDLADRPVRGRERRGAHQRRRDPRARRPRRLRGDRRAVDLQRPHGLSLLPRGRPLRPRHRGHRVERRRLARPGRRALDTDTRLDHVPDRPDRPEDGEDLGR